VGVSAALDAETSPREMLAAVWHLSVCMDCRRFVRRLVLATHVLRSTR
jgi:hypothetical protein